MLKKIKTITSLATRAILYEVSLSPKPGLVDRFNNGAHNDMTFYHFIDSAFALQPHLENYLRIGYQQSTDDLSKLFNQLRHEGQLAEQSMFNVTGNVNTHKGLNFAFALILGSIGYYFKEYPDANEIELNIIFDYVKQMAEPLVKQDFKGVTEINAKSYGEKLYAKYGILGPRGEAATGYAYLLKEILPYIDQRLEEQIDEETIYLEVLLKLMSNIEDGNLIHRGGIKQWEEIKLESANLFQKISNGADVHLLLNEYNEILVKRYLSPGGAADLLCVSIFLTHLKRCVGRKKDSD
ncbi:MULTISPECIES: triphosphoribosyl-dephospho-CoA synthase CitG [unclassified Facklamia]|uniref:triphosphoribosyl-dephospho-CoA synthase CitG n=1 Tax=Aerococcaceae TaxID=186827 RepID=UPI0013CFBCAF|nr:MULTISPECIES: triphosphoribosyl-dephospho-CoA synthase CitG [unclassified Facklamia]QQD66066.1 triphosphoribosyl-dephospho-CoA synthase CitG [Aerococcaceae bacterium zg-252]